jgi:hypothetical protein
LTIYHSPFEEIRDAFPDPGVDARFVTGWTRRGRETPEGSRSIGDLARRALRVRDGHRRLGHRGGEATCRADGGDLTI